MASLLWAIGEPLIQPDYENSFLLTFCEFPPVAGKSRIIFAKFTI
jgi:hypothetical protein